MTKPIIHYLMPAFNEESHIKEAANSLLRNKKLNVRLLIADNCSTDKTLEICKGLRKHDNRIDIFEHKINVGPINNYTFMASRAWGKYVHFVGAHDIVDDDYSEKMVEVMKDQAINPTYIIPECWMLDKGKNNEMQKKYDFRSNYRSQLYICESPIRRYLAGIKYWPVNWFNTPIREDIFKKSYKSINDIGCLNADHFFTSALLWYGKPYYTSEVKYNFRVMHPHLRESYNERMGGCAKEEITGHYRDRLYWSITYIYHFARLLINENKCSQKEAKSWLYAAAEALSIFNTEKMKIRKQLYELIELMNLTPIPN